MRISRLDLLRYGKFTDHSISLPHSTRDFHLIIGPNEAGKSTLRNAILDLLFGIDSRSTYNFLHPHSEMKLAAMIWQESNSLDFQRTKARKQSLFSPDGAPLVHDVLSQFLGTTNRTYFDQMFGLNHEKLVAGGNEILNASNDIGQILFQAAAGIDSLGKIRESLAAEADKLWSVRKSNDRAYYVASDELASAEEELKQATVRTKEWVEARSNVNQLEEALDQSKQQNKNLDVQRVRLERVRRIAATLNNLEEKESELEQLGKVIVLPTDASKQFAEMTLELTKASDEYAINKNHHDDFQNRLINIQLDENVLKHGSDIQTLTERRQQIRNHETEIIKRQQEVNSHRQHIDALVRQLGWPVEDEQRLAYRLPALPVRKTVTSLLKRHDVLEHELQTLKQAASDKTNDIKLLDEQMASLSGTTISVTFRAALAAAQRLGDVSSRSKQLEHQVTKANRELETAQAGLGQWNLDINTLRNLVLPTTACIAGFQKRLANHEATVSKLSEQLEEIAESIQAKEFEIMQYRKAHHPISIAEVMTAREGRDAIWSSIKSSAVSLHEAATDYETKVGNADVIADKRYDKAQEASTLQSKLDNLEVMRQRKGTLQVRFDTNHNALLAVQQEWMAIVNEMGLPAIPIPDIETWLQVREKALAASDNVLEAKQALEGLMREEAEVKETLLNCLNESEIEVAAAMPLSTLIVIATDAVENAVQTKTRLDELTKQRDAANAAMISLKEKTAVAQIVLNEWQSTWQENLTLAGIKENTEISAVEGALQLFNEIEEKLRIIEELQTVHIKSMQADLSNFEKEVTTLMMVIAPALQGQSSLFIVNELASQLEKTKADQKEVERLKQDCISFEKNLDEISIRIDNAKVEIHSLLQLAKVTTNDELREAIKRSDDWRNLSDAISIAKKILLDSGDGLTREQLQAEFQSTNVPEIPTNLEGLVQQQEVLQQQQITLSAALATAKAVLAKIAGQDDAVRAESKRQDALAKMAQAAERYIKVYTSARLLRWAIDRYRETKQGPMLARTEKIFSALTLGSFQKLVVDFEVQPLALEGQREDGKIVNISGMSDGTRDQLYLALRLAALELHFEQTQPLPFIADDLFINFDDARAKAGLEALANLAEKTQVIFLSHHDHLVATVQAVFGKQVNIVRL